MTSKPTLKSAIAAAVLTLTVAVQAEAENQFSTLAGIEAEPMNAAEMEATQGKGFYMDGLGNLMDVYGTIYRIVPCAFNCGPAGLLDFGLYLDPYGNQWVLDFNGVLRNALGQTWDGGVPPQFGVNIIGVGGDFLR